VAARYTDSIVTYCESLQSLPHRGVQRDGIRLGLRITSYRKRVVIAFEVNADRVAVLGVFYGGQDDETSLQEGKDEEGYFLLCWRPRRDLNPCYRRERASMARNLLKTEDTDGSQRTSEDISEMLIGRQLDAFLGQPG
jgi:toxin ParE1/3/4